MGHLGSIAIAIGEIVQVAGHRYLEAEQRRAMTGDAQSPVVQMIGQHHDGLLVQRRPLGGIARRFR